MRRRTKLSWSHHDEVAKDPDELQEKWLDLAELNGWTREELRAHRKRQSYEEAQDQVAAQAPQAYRAARRLAQGCAPVRGVAEDERREIELEKNVRRKDLTPYELSREMVRKAKKIAPVISTVAVEKDKRGRKAAHDVPKRDVAHALGVGTSSLVRAEQHVEAVQRYPELAVVAPTQTALGATTADDLRLDK